MSSSKCQLRGVTVELIWGKAQFTPLTLPRAQGKDPGLGVKSVLTAGGQARASIPLL